MNTSSSTVAAVSNVNTVAPVVSKGTAITDNERDSLTKSFGVLHGILKGMGKEGEIGADYLTNANTLGELLACAHRVWKADGEARAAKEREAFSGKIDALIQVALDGKSKILAKYDALDPELKSELPAPSPTVSIFVSDFLPVFGKGYDLTAAVKTLHDMGYMVHVAKVDGRRKEQDTTPPYLTATVGKPIRISK